MIAPMAKKSIGTHDGKFHADEAFACALLQMTDRFAQSRMRRATGRAKQQRSTERATSRS